MLLMHQQEVLKILEKPLSQLRGVAVLAKMSDDLPLIGNVALALTDVPFGHFQQRLSHARPIPPGANAVPVSAFDPFRILAPPQTLGLAETTVAEYDALSGR